MLNIPCFKKYVLKKLSSGTYKYINGPWQMGKSRRQALGIEKTKKLPFGEKYTVE